MIERRLDLARQDAEFLIERLGIRSAPVDPVAIAQSERKHLRLCPGDYKSAFDGRLEYYASKRRFLCFYNTKYDRSGEDQHAPRTRFSLAHELGHFFIESHHEYLRGGGRSHASRSEEFPPILVERQADCFAANLLMPDRQMRPLVNREELTTELIADLAAKFRTSFVSTALRAVECSHFYCAIGAIRDGSLTWMRQTSPLVENGLYPGERGALRSTSARDAWDNYRRGISGTSERAGWARDWFRIYDDELRARLPVTESYLPAPVMDTLLVLLTVPEDELWNDDD